MGGLALQMEEIARSQHGLITRPQLVQLGMSRKAIEHRLVTRRLFPIHRAVYAVGSPHLTKRGRWLAAVLACGPGALSHTSGGALWEVVSVLESNRLHVSVPAHVYRRVPGVVLHRRSSLAADLTTHQGIPVTNPVATLIDLATILNARQLETAINEADKRGLVSAERLRSTLAVFGRRQGASALRAVLDRNTFALTDSELERRFLPIARAAGLPRPQTGTQLNGFKVDFFWPDLGLVVETDGLRYHRTPAAQARDRLRDQVHTAARLTTLRFTHAQVTHDRHHVEATLEAVRARLLAALHPL